MAIGTGAATAGQAIFAAAMIVNLPLAVYVMKLLQTISYLNLINVKMPKNLQNFLVPFDINVFEFMEVQPLSERSLNCKTKFRFDIEGFSCSILNNNFLMVL